MRLILVLFFFSGATSLVYEVVWMRRLSLVFGHSIFSVSTVLTTFMSGLALGSYLGGRWSDRWRKEGMTGPRFVHLYGKLELFIGVWGVLSLVLLNLVETSFLSLSAGGVAQLALRLFIFVASFLVLLPPTTAMGATLPVFTQALVFKKEQAGARLSQIYGLNTLGACFGAALGGLALLPWLGLVKTVALTALGNLAIAAAAYQWSTRLEESPLPEPGEVAPAEQSTSQGSSLLPFVFGLSGFAGMVYQLGWTRALVLSIGSSTYSFSIILTTFLAALGLGSFLYKRLFRDRAPRVGHFAVLQILIALSALVVSLLMGYLPFLKLRLVGALGESFAAVVAADTAIVFLLLLTPALGLGLTFPLVTHLYTERLEELGRRLGEAYSANTVGAIAGSFLGGFVCIPALGLLGTIKLAAAANLLGGVVLTAGARSGRKAALGLGTASVLLLVFTPQWNLALLTAGVGIGRDKGWLEPDPIFYRDGVTSTVTVKLNAGLYPVLQVNGKADASFAPGDRTTQLLLGLIPAALHPAPEQVAVIGFGSGQTPVALLSSPGVKKVLCAELEPAVMEAKKFFAPFDEGFLDDPRLEIVEDDGRSFILGSPQKFDLIVSEPSNPWIAGIGNLYTEDFYQGCLEKLNSGGLMGQWCHIYAMSDRDIQLIYRTFFRVFPQGAVYRTSPGDLLLIGAREEVALTPARLEQLYAEGKGSGFWLHSLNLPRSAMLAGTFLASRDQVVSYLDSLPAGFEQGPVNRDDLPLLEFQAPLNLFKTGFAEAAYAPFHSLVPEALAQQPEMLEGAVLGRITLGYPLDRGQALKQLVALDPDGRRWFRPLTERVLSASSEQDLHPLVDLSGPWWAKRWLAHHLSLEQTRPNLLALYRELLQSCPPGARYGLLSEAASEAARQGELEQARLWYEEARPLTNADTPYVAGAILGPHQEWDVEALRKAISINPYSARTHNYLSAALHARGEMGPALESAQESHRLFPHHEGVLLLLIELSRASGEVDKALEYTEKLRRLRQDRALYQATTKAPSAPSGAAL